MDPETDLGDDTLALRDAISEASSNDLALERVTKLFERILSDGIDERTLSFVFSAVDIARDRIVGPFKSRRADGGLGFGSEATLAVHSQAQEPVEEKNSASDRLCRLLADISHLLETGVDAWIGAARGVAETTDNLLGSVMQQSYNLDAGCAIARLLVDAGKANASAAMRSSIPMAASVMAITDLQKAIERSLVLALDLLIPWLLQTSGADLAIPAMLQLLTETFKIPRVLDAEASPVTVFARILVASSFVENCVSDDAAVDLAERASFLRACLHRLLDSGAVELVQDTEIEALLREPNGSRTPISESSPPPTTTALAWTFIRSFLDDHEFVSSPFTPKRVQAIIDSILEMGIEEYSAEALQTRAKAGDVVRAQLSITQWILWLQVRHNRATTPSGMSPRVLFVVAWMARLIESLEAGSKANDSSPILEPSFARAVVPWAWTVGQGSWSLYNSILILTRAWASSTIVLNAPPRQEDLCAPFVSGGLPWLIDLLDAECPGNTALTDRICLVLRDGLPVSNGAAFANSSARTLLLRAFSALSSWVCDGLVTLDRFGLLNEVLSAIKTVLPTSMTLTVPERLSLAIMSFSKHLRAVEASMRKSMVSLDLQERTRFEAVVAELIDRCNFLALQEVALDGVVFETVFRFSVSEESDPSGTDDFSKRRRRVILATREACAAVLLASIGWFTRASASGHGANYRYPVNRYLPELFRQAILAGSAAGICRAATAMIATGDLRDTQRDAEQQNSIPVDSVPPETRQAKVQAEENKLWRQAWFRLCSALAPTARTYPAFAARTVRLMVRAVEYLQVRGCKRFAFSLVNAPYLRFVARLGLGAVREHLAMKAAVIRLASGVDGPSAGMPDDLEVGRTLQCFIPLLRDVLLAEGLKPTWIEEEIAGVWAGEGVGDVIARIRAFLEESGGACAGLPCAAEEAADQGYPLCSLAAE
ncbi:hypothetical protein DFJ74DRAFT_748218 [Hyaloraphidium curvatum]|nr:hypothetical protein DFJ74DRAFT_748218 [Hyaloraphidium curvatum]